MLSDVNEEVIVKKHSYNGQLYINLSAKQFIFYSSNGNKQCAIYYDISGDEFKNDKLSIILKRGTAPDVQFRMVLRQTNSLRMNECVLEVALLGPLLMVDTWKEEHTSIKKTLQIFNGYEIKIVDGGPRGSVIDAVFTHANGTECNVVVHDRSSVYEVYHWLTEAWPMKNRCTKYHLATVNTVVKEGMTFAEVAAGRGTVQLMAAENCQAGSMDGGRPTVAIAWRKRSMGLIKQLALLLHVGEEEVRLLDRDRRPLRGHLKLDIDDFRERGTMAEPSVWYDVSTTTVRCVSMRNDHPDTNMDILKDYSATEMKTKLANYFHGDPRRFIVCQLEKLLGPDDVINAATDVKYLIGESFEEVDVRTKVGQGAYGEVWRCVVRGGEERAIKKFVHVVDPRKGEALIREIVVVLAVSRHPNLVSYFDIYVDREEVYIAMEYLTGGSLRKYVADHNAVTDVGLLRRWCKDILTGVAHLHHNNVNHRDIKTDNILLASDLTAKLCDFGISKILSNINSREGALQTKGFGTSRYMAPEVFGDDSDAAVAEYGFLADIWSVGATVVEMVTGQLPHHKLENEAVPFHIRNNRTIEYLFPHYLPGSLKELLQQCLEKEPHDRPSAKYLLDHQFFKDS